MTRSIALIAGLVILCLLVIALAAMLTPAADLSQSRGLRIAGREREVGGPFWLALFPFRFGPFELRQPGLPGFISKIAGLAFVYLSWAALLFLFPERIGRMATTMATGVANSPPSTSPPPLSREGVEGGGHSHARLFAIGLAGLAAAILLNLLGLYTLVGIPVAFALTLGLATVVYAGLAGLVFELGRALRRRTGLATASPLVDLGLGTLVIYALSVVPIVGWIVIGLAAAYAFGAVLVTRFGSGASGQSWSLRALEDQGKPDFALTQEVEGEVERKW